MSRFSVTIADETVQKNGKPETTTYAFETATATPATVAAILTAALVLESALAAITLGNALHHTLTYLDQDEGSGPSTDPLAQRENKWLLRYHDTTTLQNFVISVGTADLTKKIAHSEFVDITAGEGLAVKTAFDAVVKNPEVPANACALDSIQFVGRNT